MDLVSQIMSFESGELDDKETLELFSGLVKSGQAWSLQGCYGRSAQQLIQSGYLSKKGKILKFPS